MVKQNSKAVLFLCFSTYLTAYLMRVNLSAAIPQMETQLALPSTMLGLMSSSFFIVYAFGQLINGILADVVSPFRFVLLGLIGTVCTNLLISRSTNFTLILILWTANGFFQSIFWACLTRILSVSFTQEKRSLVAMVMCSPAVGAFLIMWVALGKALDGKTWSLFFLIPALIGAVMLVIWAAASGRAKNIPLEKQRFSLATFRRSLRMIIEKKIYFYMFICVCLGFVKESISVWGPSIAGQLLGVDGKSSTEALLLIPLANLGGMFLAKRLIDRFRGNETRTLVILFCCMAAGNLLLFLLSGHLVAATVLLLAEVSAMAYGCNSILLSFIPLSFAKYGIVSTAVGMFDFCSYLGAAASSAVMGAILTHGDWRFAALLWAGLAALAVGLCLLARKKINKVKACE